MVSCIYVCMFIVITMLVIGGVLFCTLMVGVFGWVGFDCVLGLAGGCCLGGWDSFVWLFWV